MPNAFHSLFSLFPDYPYATDHQERLPNLYGRIKEISESTEALFKATKKEDLKKWQRNHPPQALEMLNDHHDLTIGIKTLSMALLISPFLLKLSRQARMNIKTTLCGIKMAHSLTNIALICEWQGKPGLKSQIAAEMEQEKKMKKENNNIEKQIQLVEEAEEITEKIKNIDPRKLANISSKLNDRLDEIAKERGNEKTTVQQLAVNIKSLDYLKTSKEFQKRVSDYALCQESIAFLMAFATLLVKQLGFRPCRFLLTTARGATCALACFRLCTKEHPNWAEGGKGFEWESFGTILSNVGKEFFKYAAMVFMTEIAFQHIDPSHKSPFAEWIHYLESNFQEGAAPA
ncbi:MAG: hypothetical protein VXZ72_00220 [Chlamydiota bacterium]|nr:hypothetical protein [Chlamydiota bacterium]